MRFGVSHEELKAILEAKNQPTLARASMPPRARPAPATGSRTPAAASTGQGARLMALDRVDPVAAEYALLKDEVLRGHSLSALLHGSYRRKRWGGSQLRLG